MVPPKIDRSKEGEWTLDELLSLILDYGLTPGITSRSSLVPEIEYAVV